VFMRVTMTMILLHIVARRLNRYMHRQKQLKHIKVNDLTTTYTCTIEMRVTIEDGVYSLVIEVKIESMFDNSKGRMIRTTDIF